MPRTSIQVALLARDVMTPDPITVSESLSVSDLARLFTENQISGVPVTDDAGALIGVVSQTDLIRRTSGAERPEVQEIRRPTYHQLLDSGIFEEFDEEFLSALPEEEIVGEICSRSAITAPPEFPLLDLLELMVAHDVHRVVVVDVDRQPVGIVSSMDVLRCIRDCRHGQRTASA